METQDKVVIGIQSGEGLQQQCVVCGTQVSPAGPIPEDLKSLIENLFNLLFDMDTWKGLLNWESGGLFLCQRCKPILEEAKEGTDEVICMKKKVKGRFQELLTKVNLLKRTAESAAISLQRISNPKGAEAILDVKIEAGDMAGHFRIGIEKAKEKILLLLSSINHGKLILNGFRPSYVSGALESMEQVCGEEEETTAEGPSTNNFASAEEMRMMDSVKIDKHSGEGRQQECRACGTGVPPARPTDDCESTIESFFNLFFEKETMEELEISGVGNNDSLCTECKAKLEKAKEETEKVVLNEKAVNKTFVKLIEEVEYLKLAVNWAISSFNCISNSNRFNDRLTDQDENKTAQFQRLMLKGTEKLSLFRDSLKGGKLALDCFKLNYISISSPSESVVEPGEIVETATQGPSCLNLRKSCLALRMRLSPSLRKSLSIADTSSRNTADLASAEENNVSGIEGATESESSAASSFIAKRVTFGDVLTLNENEASYETRTVSSLSPEREIENFHGPSLPSQTEEFQDYNRSSEEDVTMMETCDDEVLIDSGEGQQKECLVCRADVPAGGPNDDDLKSLVRDFGELIFDSKTLDGLENCGYDQLNMCEICIQELEEAKKGTEKIILLERIVNDINRRLIEKLSDLKLTAEKTVSSLKKISNSMGAQAMTTDKADAGDKAASAHLRRGILKSTENFSMYQESLKREKSALDCFKSDSLNLSTTLKTVVEPGEIANTATPGPSGMKMSSVLFSRLSLSGISLANSISSDTGSLIAAEVATAQENHAGTASSVESDFESEIAPSLNKRKKRNVFREDEEESQNEVTSNFASKTASSPESITEKNSNGTSPFSEGENFQDRNASSEESSDDEASSIRKSPGKASTISSAVSETNTVQQSSSTGESSSKTKKSSYYFKRSGMFHCKRCDKTFKSWPGIITHFESVHVNKRYKCDLCKVAVFTHHTSLTGHKKRCQKRIDKRLAREKDPMYKFVCEICGARFNKKHYLSNHLNNVHSVDRFPCDLCEKAFKTKHTLRLHKDGVHLRKEYFCRFCKKKFGSRGPKCVHERSCSKKTTK